MADFNYICDGVLWQNQDYPPVILFSDKLIIAARG